MMGYDVAVPIESCRSQGQDNGCRWSLPISQGGCHRGTAHPPPQFVGAPWLLECALEPTLWTLRAPSTGGLWGQRGSRDSSAQGCWPPNCGRSTATRAPDLSLRCQLWAQRLLRTCYSHVWVTRQNGCKHLGWRFLPTFCTSF